MIMERDLDTWENLHQGLEVENPSFQVSCSYIEVLHQEGHIPESLTS